MKKSTITLLIILISITFIPRLCYALDDNTNNDTPYVLGEVLVEYKQGNDPQTIKARVDLRKQRTKTVIGRLNNFQEDAAYFLRGELKPEEIKQKLDSINKANKIENTAKINSTVYKYQSTKSTDVNKMIAKYSELGIVKTASPNYLLMFFDTPNDYYFTRQWGLSKMQFDKAWDITKGDNNIKIAIIDSGTDNSHPDLASNLVEVKVIDGADATYYDGHGTHVTGIIAATVNNTIGVAGGARQVSLLSLKADSLVDTSRGKEHGLKLDVVAKAIDYAISQNVDIINMSIGAPVDEPILKTAVDSAYNHGITVIAASGNSGTKETYYPAGYTNVISVGAVGPNDELAHYSSWGDYLDLVASGGNPYGYSDTCRRDHRDCIISTWHRSFICPNMGTVQQYCSITGTSMAAPFVSAAASLLLSIDNNLQPDQIQNILTQTAFDLGPTGRDDQYGYGRLDIKKAIDYISGQPTVQPTNQVTSSPSTIYPTPTTSELQHPCFDKAVNGDYNCDGIVNKADFDKWLEDAKMYIDLRFFEWIRRAYFGS